MYHQKHLRKTKVIVIPVLFPLPLLLLKAGITYGVVLNPICLDSKLAPTQLAFGLVADLVFKFGIHQKPALAAGCDGGECTTHGGLSLYGRNVCFDVAFSRCFGCLVSFPGEVDSCMEENWCRKN